MRKLLLSCLLLLPLLQTSAQQNAKKPTSATQTIYDLSDALKQKLVSITVVGTGGHSGESLKITCRNLRGKFLRLNIPQGQLMEPADSSMQTLVVAQAVSLAVTVKTPVEAALKTFCTQAGDSSPMAGTGFAIGAMAPDKVCRLLKFLSEKGKIDSDAAQSAVWCITNGVELSGIGDPEIVRFTADLLGKKPPGYHIKYETREVPGLPADLGKALEFDSNFAYTLDKDDYLSLNLYGPDDKLVKVIRKDEATKAGEHRTSLHLKLWNLDPGKYSVRLQRKNGALIKEMVIQF